MPKWPPAERVLSQGTATATLISPREFFREALRHGATAAIAWHNHPSGDPTHPRKTSSSPPSSGSWRKPRRTSRRSHHRGPKHYHSFRAAEGWDRPKPQPPPPCRAFFMQGEPCVTRPLPKIPWPSTGQRPWHHLGVQFDREFTSAEAIAAGPADYPVSRSSSTAFALTWVQA